MKLVIQRVGKARVSVKGVVVGEIGKGYLVLFGVRDGDTQEESEKLADKLIKMRLMADSNGKMNLNINDAQSSILVVSQFTLYADTSGGNRPSFVKAADPKIAEQLYDVFIDRLKSTRVEVQTGRFGEYMEINAFLDGPVTIVVSSDK